MGEIIKEKWISSAWLKFLTISSVILIIASFVIPPTGIIDPSVLMGIGELEILAGIWIIYDAVKKGTGAHLKKGDISIDIDENDEE